MTTPINPYVKVGDQVKTGLNSIASASPSTDQNIIDAVFGFIKITYYPSITTIQEVEIRSMIANCMNTYLNVGNYANYTPAQLEFINLMTGPSFVNGLTVDTLGSRITDIEDNITKSGLSLEEQQPLLMATAIGNEVYIYFLATILTPPTPNPWGPYLNTAVVSAIANLPFWVAASMQATLIGARTTRQGLIAPTTDIVSVEIISALAAVLTIVSGKIMNKWIPRIQLKPLMLNKEIVADLNRNDNNPGNRHPGTGNPETKQNLPICQIDTNNCASHWVWCTK